MKNKNKELLAFFLGLFFAVPTYFILDFFKIPNPLIWAAITGLLYNLFIYILLVFVEANHTKRLEKAKEGFENNIFYEFNGNLKFSDKVENCAACFCDNGIVFISVEKREPRYFRIPHENIFTIHCDDKSYVYIITFDKCMYPISCVDIDALSNALYEHGWLAEFEENEKTFDENSKSDADKNSETSDQNVRQ